jgi:hypothetical protein
MDFEKHQCILTAVEALHAAGSWTGKTHVQKTLALASLALGEDLPFEFVLYRHGPYSFEVDGEINQMLTYDAIKMIPQPPYGATVKPAAGSDFPDAFGNASPETLKVISDIAKFVGSRNVTQLESLATAAWIRIRENVRIDEQVLRRLLELKPHLEGQPAQQGVHDSSVFHQSFILG